ncbi:hypothetical protein SYNPS1DRAFT_31732 [Syncephalis pseudoplumigaleata]|uniref:Uncharacterized protein n=1 Tax=Syncephalis pseudoplumigaleata TaxID=1712513 RepID=A0A4P9YTZ8_9FUNG|nr:hypothetical protein SYNPS1DRAFT_31732 [Syncephalis pseudoplumigaleata]|eukprot:RKP22651.1 hypothetical protein SYNPS1DRAFT_31732 [Syncephalis pseudoplumigaleata]
MHRPPHSRGHAPKRGGGRGGGRGRFRGRGWRRDRAEEAAIEALRATIPRLDNKEEVARWLDQRKRKYPQGHAAKEAASNAEPASALELLGGYGTESDVESKQPAVAVRPANAPQPSVALPQPVNERRQPVLAKEREQERLAILQCLMYIADNYYKS